MLKAWTSQEEQTVLELINQHMMYKDISSALLELGFERSPEAIRSFLRRYKNKGVTEVTEETYDYTEEEDNFSRAIREIHELKEKIIDIHSSRFKRVGRPTKPTNHKVLCISDLHIPFDNNETIAHALKNHGDADTLVVNGDIFELYAVSQWPKYKNIVLKWEYQVAIEWMKLFSKMFKKVYLTSGNHEQRLRSYFSSNIDPMVSFLVSDDMLSRLAKGYDFDEDGSFIETHNFKNVHYQSGLLSWYTKIGQCLFVHPRSFSKVAGKTATNSADSFLGRETFQAIVVGHTHKICKIIYRDKLLIEQGCCCVPMDYESDGKMRYLPQAFGYAVVYLDEDGNVDFDKSNPVYLGTGFPTKNTEI
jgi:predicted phosphodiesterase